MREMEAQNAKKIIIIIINKAPLRKKERRRKKKENERGWGRNWEGNERK